MKGQKRRFFPLPALRFFIGLFIILLCTALCVEMYLQHQISTSHMSRSWTQEDARIKQSNLTKLSGLDATFPLMATPGGIAPMQGGKSHRIVVIGDSFAWGDGLANINDVWWRQIERELERRGYHDVEVVALGWNGAQTKEQLAWLRDPRFTELNAEAIILGYVVNDPDMGVLPQDYKAVRLFFVDDLFRWWLPELTAQFQARYMRKQQARLCKEGADYGYNEWVKLLLQGENFALWQKLIPDLAQQLKALQIPSVMVSLPVVPDRSYYGPLYEKPVQVIAENGIPFINLLEDYIQYGGEDAASSPYRWTANPANGHPGAIATHYHARKAVDWLEANALHALGSKGIPAKKQVRTNDWYPWKANASIEDAALRLWLPEFREMGLLPIGKPHVLVSFERPIALAAVTITSSNARAADIFVSTVNAEGYDDGVLLKCQQQKNTFTVPDVPQGALVNTIRIIPVSENKEMTAILEIK